MDFLPRKVLYEYLYDPVYKWKQWQLWECACHAVSVFLHLSGWICRSCWALCCYGYSCSTTWACCMQETAWEMSMQTAVSTINARQMPSESQSNSNCKGTLGSLQSGTCSPISTSWEKKAARFGSLFFQFDFRWYKKPAPGGTQPAVLGETMIMYQEDH